MSKKLHKAIYQYVSELKHHYAYCIITVVLFGSTARGESGKESDADILIVTSEKNPQTKDAMSMAAYDIMLKNNVVLSPLVMDTATFAWYKKFKDPLYKNIKKDGINIWTQTPGSLLKSA